MGWFFAMRRSATKRPRPALAPSVDGRSTTLSSIVVSSLSTALHTLSACWRTRRCALLSSERSSLSSAARRDGERERRRRRRRIVAVKSSTSVMPRVGVCARALLCTTRANAPLYARSNAVLFILIFESGALNKRRRIRAKKKQEIWVRVGACAHTKYTRQQL